MYSKFLSKLFYSSSREKVVKLFKPSSPLNFENGKFLVFQLKSLDQVTSAKFIFGLLFLTTYFSGKKVYHYDQRRWIGLFFYGTIFGFSVLFLRKTEGVASRFVTQMYLLKDGRHVQIYRRRFLYFNDKFTVPISDISCKSPEEMIKNFKQEQLFFIKAKIQKVGKLNFMRESYVPDSDVMKAILNGTCIDTLEEGEVEVF